MRGKNKCRWLGAMLALLLLLLTACGTATEGTPTLTAVLTEDIKFGSAITDLTAEDFQEAGFSFGDSFDVVISNGYTLTDVPYYDGYYVKTGDPVIVAYPTDDNVKIACNNQGFWALAELTEGCTAEIALHTEGKYLATYEVLAQRYSTDRSAYESDEAFANFRAISVRNMKENFIYRGASPVNNGANRAAVVDALLERAGIRNVINLSDSVEDMEGYFAEADFSSAYTKALYEEGRDIPLSMSSNYDSDAYREGVAKGMRQLLAYGGPAYIHCMEGKDRTGFVCFLLEALVGSDYDEMCADYMKTYENYYGVSKEKTPEKYDAIVSLYFDSFAGYLSKTEDADAWKTMDYSDAAKEYLSDCGMTEQEIAALCDLLSA